MYIKTFEDFSTFNLEDKLSTFYESVQPIIEKYDNPNIEVGSIPQINSLKDLYNIVKSVPKNFINFCQTIYDENQKEIDKLSIEFKSNAMNEEMCILTFLSLCLLAWAAWRHFGPSIKRKIGYDNSGRAGAGGFKMGYFNKFKGRHAEDGEYSKMSQERLKRLMDKALDDKDFAKAKEINKYLD